MRWPIRLQLLLPNLSVVVVAIVVATGVTAYVGGLRARQAQEDSLRRMVNTLAEATFPLTDSILRQMRGLSGREFVLFDRQEVLQASTLSFSDIERIRLLAIPIEPPDQGRAGRLATSPTVSLGGSAYLGQRVAVAPHDPVSSAGSLVVLYPKDLWWAAARQAAYPAIAVGVAAVAAVVLITLVLAHRFVRPIHDLRQHAAAIAQGNFQPIAVAQRNDEIRDLAISIHQMAEQLGRYEGHIRRHEQLRTLGQLGAGIAHQLRNAATGGRMAIELHQRECDAGRGSESLDVALRQLRLMESYLQRFLDIGRAQPITPEPVALTGVVASAVTMVQPTCEHAGVELVFREPPLPFWIRGDADAIRQVVLNLVLNGIEAIGEAVNGDAQQPQIRVTIEPDGENCVSLQVCDSGAGPAEDVAAQLFEPFVTNKAAGTGLGLYVARQVAEAHQGTIHWQRVDGQTCFSLRLPLTTNHEEGRGSKVK